MKNILNFFKPASGKVADFLKMLYNKIFWRQAEEMRRARIIKGAILAVVAVVIIVLIGWLALARFGSQKNAQNEVANPIAEAKLTVVTSRACGKTCWDAQLFIDALAQQGVKVSGKEIIYVSAWWPFGRGADFVKKFQINKVPTVVIEFTGDTKPDINNFFSPTLGSVIDGKFVLTKILAPYFDLTDKKIKGLIKVTYLTDKSCAACYDIKKHETALKNLGAPTDNSETVDISSDAGKALITKYGITKVPTMLITGEVSEYTVLTQAWPEVGKIAEDGAYVFTNVDLMGDSYKDLTTGKIIKANPPATTPTTVK